jgi:hypothetical protein
MDYSKLFEVADQARGRTRLSDADVAFIRDEAPAALAAFPHVRVPERIDHPAGFTVKGAPVGTFTRSALLLGGQKALGRRFGGHPFYEHVEAYTALAIMRANFEGSAPKGTFCCAQCTLAILPVLAAGAIRYFDCAPLARDVRALVEAGGWRFANPPNRHMRDWAMNHAPRKAVVRFSEAR